MADYEILAQIEVLLKGQADTKKRLDEIDKAGQRVEGSLKRSGAAAEGLQRKLLTLFSAAVIGAFASRVVEELATVERGFSAIGFMLDRLGIGAEKNLPKVRAFIESLGAEKLRDTIPAFQRFLGITESIEGAMAAVKLAVDLSERSSLDLGATVGSLTQLLQGRANEAANTFGLALRKQNGEMKTNRELLKELIDLNEGFSDKQKDTAEDLDRVTASLTKFRLVAGEVIAPILGGLALILEGIGNTAKSVKPTLEGIAGALGNVLRGEGTIAIEETWLHWRESMATIWGGGALDTAKEIADGTNDLLAEADKKDRERKDQERAERQKKEEDLARQIAERKLQIERESSDRLLAAQIQGAEENSVERERLEILALGRIRDRALEEARKVGADTAEIEEAFRVAKEVLEAEYRERRSEEEVKEAEETERKRLEAIRAVLEARVAAASEEDPLARADAEVEALREELARKLEELTLSEEQRAILIATTEERILQVRKRAVNADLEIERRRKQEKLQLQQTVADAAFTAAGAIFGQTKALAIAQALVNTYLAAAQALTFPPGPPVSLAYVALAIAQGLAQVANIRKQNFTKGKGFDDPEHDRLAYLGGRRWAEDMVRNITAGFRGGIVASIPSAAASSTTSIRHGDTVVNIGSLYGGDAGLRQLRRELDQAKRRDAARRVGG